MLDRIRLYKFGVLIFPLQLFIRKINNYNQIKKNFEEGDEQIGIVDTKTKLKKAASLSSSRIHGADNSTTTIKQKRNYTRQERL